MYLKPVLLITLNLNFYLLLPDFSFHINRVIYLSSHFVYLFHYFLSPLIYEIKPPFKCIVYYTNRAETNEKLQYTRVDMKYVIKGRLDIVEVYVLLPYTERRSRSYRRCVRSSLGVPHPRAQTHKRNGSGTHTEARKCSRGPS